MSAIILHMSCSKYLVCCYYLAQSCTFSVLPLPTTLAYDVDSARWLLPTLEVLWGICTFAQSRVTNVHQLYALRFLVGMLEAPVFAGTHFILGTPFPPPPHTIKKLTVDNRFMVLRPRTLQTRRHVVHLQPPGQHGKRLPPSRRIHQPLRRRGHARLALAFYYRRHIHHSGCHNWLFRVSRYTGFAEAVLFNG